MFRCTFGGLRSLAAARGHVTLPIALSMSRGDWNGKSNIDALRATACVFSSSAGRFLRGISKISCGAALLCEVVEDASAEEILSPMRLALPLQDRRRGDLAPAMPVDIVRTTMQALSAVLSSCQSLHPTAMTEPTRCRQRTRCAWRSRTQQIVRRTRCADVVDPIGSSAGRDAGQRIREADLEILDY